MRCVTWTLWARFEDTGPTAFVAIVKFLLKGLAWVIKNCQIADPPLPCHVQRSLMETKKITYVVQTCLFDLVAAHDGLHLSQTFSF